MKGGFMSEKQQYNRRWYDKDPVLKEALEVLRKSSSEQKENAKDFMLTLEENLAQGVIERVYQIVTRYQGVGNRWYDNDPVMIKAVEMLRLADPKTQRVAALRILLALERNSFENV